MPANPRLRAADDAGIIVGEHGSWAALKVSVDKPRGFQRAIRMVVRLQRRQTSDEDPAEG